MTTIYRWMYLIDGITATNTDIHRKEPLSDLCVYVCVSVWMFRMYSREWDVYREIDWENARRTTAVRARQCNIDCESKRILQTVLNLSSPCQILHAQTLRTNTILWTDVLSQKESTTCYILSHNLVKHEKDSLIQSISHQNEDKFHLSPFHRTDALLIEEH